MSSDARGESVPNAAAAMGTYAVPVRITECETCTKNTTTVNTMLTVMQQQAATIRDQQATISNLLAVLGNIESPLKTTKIPVPPSRPIGKKIVSITKKAKEKPTASGSIVRGRGRPRKHPHTTGSTGAPTRERSLDDYEPLPDVNHHDSVTPDNNNNAFVSLADSLGTGDTVEVTKIWIRGNADPKEKTPCPLPECTNRKFGAADIYYLRRHFQQVHRLTHPNPIIIIQCPVEDCPEEFDGSYRDMRKHLVKDHGDLFSKLGSPRRSVLPPYAPEEEIEGAESTDNTMEEVEGDEAAPVDEEALPAAEEEETEPAEEAAEDEPMNEEE